MHIPCRSGACSRMGSDIQQRSRLLHRFPEQARSHRTVFSGKFGGGGVGLFQQHSKAVERIDCAFIQLGFFLRAERQ